ncbi:MAG: hypothetical protein K9J13_10395 [Saprospiraceae bacterium]|nr:hypothetical protein [Saprospiraceae bacterium]
MRRFFVLALLLCITLINNSCCKRTNPTVTTIEEIKVEDIQTQPQQSYAGPHVLIYKTSGDYSNNVPVILSEDKTKIVSYPDIKDVYTNGKLALPEQLANGFLLDNRGINKDVAFTNYSYEEYRNLEKTPSAAELLERVIDKDPLVELYDCGVKYKYKSLVSELNELISNNQFENFIKLK